jgi:hypothetical protein
MYTPTEFGAGKKGTLHLSNAPEASVLNVQR